QLRRQCRSDRVRAKLSEVKEELCFGVQI
ncbi:MAG: hypothetical protein QOF90_3453, partial [Acetobacteraceae bacterium]|nr:hypothetical protein [Acetobacteraceae bacterium]